MKKYFYQILLKFQFPDKQWQAFSRTCVQHLRAGYSQLYMPRQWPRRQHTHRVLHAHSIHMHACTCTEHTCAHTHTRSKTTVRAQECYVYLHAQNERIRMGKAFILLFRATGSWVNQVAIPTFLCRWEASINQWKVVFRQEREAARRGGYDTMNAATCPSSWVSSSEITGSLVWSWSGLLPGSLRRIHSAWLGPSVQMLKWSQTQRYLLPEGVNTTSTFRTLEKWCWRPSELFRVTVCFHSHLCVQSLCACQSSKCGELTWLSLCLADWMWDLPEL